MITLFQIFFFRIAANCNDSKTFAGGMKVAKGGGIMKDKSFETAMNKIALQAEALELKEARDAKRRRRLLKIRGFFMFLFIASIFAVVLDKHSEIQAAIYAKIAPEHASPLARFGLSATMGTNGTGVTNYTPGTIAGTLDRAEGKVQNSLNAAAQNAAIRDSIIDQVGAAPTTVAATAPDTASAAK
jgi:hypothetical protein